jgi:hypothetical protein
VASEEQDVHPDHNTCYRNHVQRGGCRPSHGATLPGRIARPDRG